MRTPAVAQVRSSSGSRVRALCAELSEGQLGLSCGTQGQLQWSNKPAMRTVVWTLAY